MLTDGDNSEVCAQEMGVTDCDDVMRALRMFVTKSLRSNSKSCCIKLKFGEIISLRDWTWSKAWSKVKDLWTIR